MNLGYFQVGKRYIRNDGEATYYAMSERYTTAGYRYITFRSDLNGCVFERKVRLDKDNVEWIDALGGAFKGATSESNYSAKATNLTYYISMTENESKLDLLGECEMTVEEIKNYFDKMKFDSERKFKIQLI